MGGIISGCREKRSVRKHGTLISRDDSRLAAYVIPTDEELLIARDTARCIQGEPNPQ